jgi:ubiquinone/menaquinone biosynthesis C-methylase UbiE
MSAHEHPHHHHHFLPGMGHPALTPFYDTFARLIARESTFKRRLVERLGLRAGQRVLDVGCGTGTLALMIAEARPDAEITGIDPDEEMLSRARKKATAAGARIRLERASAAELPFADGSFDRVTSTLMAHHLPTPAKQAMFAEIQRVLAPTGELHLVDIGPARAAVARSLQRLLRPHVLDDNLDGKLPAMMSAAGLAAIAEEDRVVTVFGPLVFWRARSGGRDRTWPGGGPGGALG